MTAGPRGLQPHTHAQRQIYAQRGIQLFDDPLDPRLPNRKFSSG